jgi:hypothetical protein
LRQLLRVVRVVARRRLLLALIMGLPAAAAMGAVGVAWQQLVGVMELVVVAAVNCRRHHQDWAQLQQADWTASLHNETQLVEVFAL